MRMLMLSVIATVGLWAVDATIVNNSVTVTIDGKIAKHTKKGDSFKLQAKQKICLVSKKGDGAVKILYPTGLNIQLKNPSDCETVPPLVGVEEMGFIEGIIVTLFQKSQDSSTNGVGAKGGDDEVITTDINLEEVKRTMNYIHISNSTGRWTTPIELEILGKDVAPIKIEYKDDGFLVPVDILKVGQNIKISGKFSGTVLDVKVR